MPGPLDRLDALLRARCAADPAFSDLLRATAGWLEDLAVPPERPGPLSAEPSTASPETHLRQPAGRESAVRPTPPQAAELSAAEPPIPELPSPELPSPEPPVEPAPAAPTASAEDIAALRARFADGDYVPAPEPRAPVLAPERTIEHDVLLQIAACAAVKADAARFQAAGDVDEEAEDAFRRRAAGQKSCVLWMLGDDLPGASVAAFQSLADAFGAVGAAATVLHAFATTDADLHDGAPYPRAVLLAAEAQSALRTAFHTLHGRNGATTPPSSGTEEPTGLALFSWLRETAQLEQVFVPRYMKVDDPADPARARYVIDELAALGREAGPAARPRSTDTDKALNAARYHLRRLAENGYDADDQARRSAERITELLAAGVPPSHVSLREALLPVLEQDDLAERLRRTADGTGAALALREADRYLAFRLDDAADEEDEGQPLSDDVLAVRALLGGRTLALFGGVAKPHVVQRIEEAFGAPVEWVETREHQSTAPFETVVARDDVALVGLFIRWCSHSFDDLKAMCETHGTAYVRIPAGNHPNRLAHVILAQVGSELQSV